MSVVVQLPEGQLGPLRDSYRSAAREKQRQLVLALVVVAAMVALSAFAAEINLQRFAQNFWRFPDYFVRIFHFDQGPLTGRPVIVDISDWFWGVANGRWLKQLAETVLIAYVGTILGAVGAFFLAFHSARNLARPRPARSLAEHALAFAQRAAWFFAIFMIGGLALDQLARLVGANRLPFLPLGVVAAALGLAALTALPATLLTKRFLEFCRTVPEIVFALIFVVAFGLGPVPGVLAIAIHTMGALGKLFAEVVENIDMRPVEGAVATGSSWTAMIRFAVVPQVLSNFTSYALLRFEINVRGAAIMGFVGAGGIGQDLIEAIRKFYYADVSALLLLIIATVMVIDLVTEQLRHRLIGMERAK